MSDYAWQPVEGQTRIACDCGECDRTIEVDDGYMQIYGDDEEELTAHLPDEYALCRRVPASAGVPVEVTIVRTPYDPAMWYADHLGETFTVVRWFNQEVASRTFVPMWEVDISRLGITAKTGYVPINLTEPASQQPQPGQEAINWLDAQPQTGQE